MVKMGDLTDNIVATLLDLDRGDTFEARLRSESGLEFVQVFEVDGVREVGDRNGFLNVSRIDGNIPNNTRRLYATDDGVSVARGWSPTDTIIQNIALELDTLKRAEYHLEVSRDSDGGITESRLVRDDEVSASSATTNL